MQAHIVQPSAMAALTKRSQQSGTESCVGYGHVPGKAETGSTEAGTSVNGIQSPEMDRV